MESPPKKNRHFDRSNSRSFRIAKWRNLLFSPTHSPVTVPYVPILGTGSTHLLPLPGLQHLH
jgi:hypothetical protein